MKVFIASLSTETNSFSPLPTGRLSFEEGGVAHGDATRGPVTYASGPMHVWRDAAEARGWQVVTFAEPTWRALLALALGWALATPALAWLARLGSASTQPRPATRGARA